MKKILLGLFLLINIGQNLNSTPGTRCYNDYECDTDEGERCNKDTAAGTGKPGRCSKK